MYLASHPSLFRCTESILVGELFPVKLLFLHTAVTTIYLKLADVQNNFTPTHASLGKASVLEWEKSNSPPIF